MHHLQKVIYYWSFPKACCNLHFFAVCFPTFQAFIGFHLCPVHFTGVWKWCCRNFFKERQTITVLALIVNLICGYAAKDAELFGEHIYLKSAKCYHTAILVRWSYKSVNSGKFCNPGLCPMPMFSFFPHNICAWQLSCSLVYDAFIHKGM